MFRASVSSWSLEFTGDIRVFKQIANEVGVLWFWSRLLLRITCRWGKVGEIQLIHWEL